MNWTIYQRAYLPVIAELNGHPSAFRMCARFCYARHCAYWQTQTPCIHIRVYICYIHFQTSISISISSSNANEPHTAGQTRTRSTERSGGINLFVAESKARTVFHSHSYAPPHTSTHTRTLTHGTSLSVYTGFSSNRCQSHHRQWAISICVMWAYMWIECAVYTVAARSDSVMLFSGVPQHARCCEC